MKKPDHWLVEHVIKTVVASTAFCCLSFLVLWLCGILPQILAWFCEETIVHRWHYWLIAVAAPGLAFGAGMAMKRRLIPAASVGDEPDYTSYCQDEFFNFQWRWTYHKGQVVKRSIQPFCPDCARRLTIDEDYMGTSLTCNMHGRQHLRMSFQDLVEKVRVEILHKIETRAFAKADC